jgi:hypothetical protein
MHDELRAKLRELVNGSLDEAEAEALRTRITSDRAVACQYARIKLQSELAAQGAPAAGLTAWSDWPGGKLAGTAAHPAPLERSRRIGRTVVTGISLAWALGLLLAAGAAVWSDSASGRPNAASWSSVADAYPRLLVTGPSTLHRNRPARYEVMMERFDSTPLPLSVRAQLTDLGGTTVWQQQAAGDKEGRCRFQIPPQGAGDGHLRLQVAAQRRSADSEGVESESPRFVSWLAVREPPALPHSATNSGLKDAHLGDLRELVSLGERQLSPDAQRIHQTRIESTQHAEQPLPAPGAWFVEVLSDNSVVVASCFLRSWSGKPPAHWQLQGIAAAPGEGELVGQRERALYDYTSAPPQLLKREIHPLGRSLQVTAAFGQVDYLSEEPITVDIQVTDPQAQPLPAVLRWQVDAVPLAESDLASSWQPPEPWPEATIATGALPLVFDNATQQWQRFVLQLAQQRQDRQAARARRGFWLVAGSGVGFSLLFSAALLHWLPGARVGFPIAVGLGFSFFVGLLAMQPGESLKPPSMAVVPLTSYGVRAEPHDGGAKSAVASQPEAAREVTSPVYRSSAPGATWSVPQVAESLTAATPQRTGSTVYREAAFPTDAAGRARLTFQLANHRLAYRLRVHAQANDDSGSCCLPIPTLCTYELPR